MIVLFLFFVVVAVFAWVMIRWTCSCSKCGGRMKRRYGNAKNADIVLLLKVEIMDMISVIRWRKDDRPDEGDTCLVMQEDGQVVLDYWTDGEWTIAEGNILGWCRTWDVETYDQVQIN